MKNRTAQTSNKATMLKEDIAKAYTNVFNKVVFWSKVLFTITFLVSCVGIGFIINEYLNTHTFTWQQPVIVRTPLVIERVQLISPQATQSAQLKKDFKPTSLIPTAYAYKAEVEKATLIEQTKNPAIVWRIYYLESTFGKADGCKLKGKVNGYGFRQNTRENFCFDTFEDATRAVDDWLTEKLAEMDIPTALCYYNRGERVNNCEYFNKYMTTL